MNDEATEDQTKLIQSSNTEPEPKTLKDLEVQADIISETELHQTNNAEDSDSSNTPESQEDSHTNPHGKIQETTQKISNRKYSEEEKLRPTTAPLPCTPGGRPKFCSYYAFGNRHDSVSQKRTFNVKSSTDVYPTAKWVRNPTVIKAKAEQLKRVPKPKTSVADAPYNRWVTTNQVTFKAQPQKIKAKVKSY